MRIRAIILEGEADAATIAVIRAAMEAPELSIVFAAPRIGEIAARVAYETGVPVAEIAGESRTQRTFRARCAIAMLARSIGGKTVEQIGAVLGGRDHSTIIMALRRADQFMAKDPSFRQLIATVTRYFDEEKPQ